MSMVQQAIEVSAPLHTVYQQLAAFENYPRFMADVERVTPFGDRQTHWVMDVNGQRREFDAQITEMSYDKRVSWATVAGPRLAETITVRPVGETRTQVVAQLEADVAFLMPSDRHAQETLDRRLKDDLAALKGLVESGVMGEPTDLAGASSKQLSGQSSTIFGSGTMLDPASPASVAGRARNRPQPVDADLATRVDIGVDRADAPAPGRRISTGGKPLRGGSAGAAPMGGRTPARDAWGDGMINEEDRGGAHDFRR